MVRRLLVTLLLLALLTISVSAGIVAADWPAWRRLFSYLWAAAA